MKKTAFIVRPLSALFRCRRVASLLVIFVCIGYPAFSQSITVYRDANWSGESMEIVGDWDQSSAPDWNDQISSIRIPPGARIQAYADGQYQGESRMMTSDWTTNNGDFNDVISSIRFLHRNNSRQERPMNERRQFENTPVVAATPAATNRLCCGQELSLGGELHALNHRYMLAFQQDRNLVVYKTIPATSPLWATATNNRVNRCVMQADGNLVLYSGGNPIWSSNTYGNQNAYLVMQDDGNLVIYSTDGRPIWASNTMQPGEQATAPQPNYQPMTQQTPAYQPAPKIAPMTATPAGPCEMERSSYESAVHAIEGQAFKESKMQVARQAIRNKCLSVNQVRGLARLFAFEEQKLEFVKYAYEYTDNKGDYYTLSDVFSFKSNVQDFNAFLATK